MFVFSHGEMSVAILNYLTCGFENAYTAYLLDNYLENCHTLQKDAQSTISVQNVFHNSKYLASYAGEACRN
jgi:hypothetical protein